MQGKLTLSMDKAIIAFAHTLALYTHTTISKMIENYLKEVMIQTTNGQNDDMLGLGGILEGMPDIDKKELRIQFHEAHSH
jgi:hypothetical protein